MWRQLREKLRKLDRPAVFGAWFFVIATMIPMSWTIGQLADGAGTVSIYRSTVDGIAHSPWPLTYEGIPGLGKALLQSAIAIGAMLVTILPGLSLRTQRWGHALLVGWAATWAINLAWLTSHDGLMLTASQATLATTLLGCTIWRAISNWNGGPPHLLRKRFRSIAGKSSDSQTDAADVTSDFYAHGNLPPLIDRLLPCREHKAVLKAINKRAKKLAAEAVKAARAAGPVAQHNAASVLDHVGRLAQQQAQRMQKSQAPPRDSAR